MKKLPIVVALACFSPLPIKAAKAKKHLPYNLSEEHVPGQLIVGFENDIAPELKDFVIRRIDAYKSKKHQLQGVDRKTVLIETVSLAANTDELVKFADYIKTLPGVRFVEANVIYHLSETTPNDPEFNLLYALKNEKSTSSSSRKDIGATLAWDETTGSKDVLVAVIDTGIDYTHEDLADNYWTNPGESGLDENGEDKRSNGIDDDNNGYVDDWRGWDFANGDNDPMDGHSHGTHCAGTIGAVGNNGIGVAGVNWDVSLVGIKIFSDSGSTTADAIVSGIDYASAIGVDLSSNSWGGPNPSDAIREAIERANDAGILFVAAAGNSSTNNDVTPNYPSSYNIPNVIGVASTDDNDNRSSFSSYGPNTVHIAAPGSRIYSTVPNNGYDYKSGTSMATPHAAGLFALVMSKYSDLSHLEIKERVLRSAEKTGNFLSYVRYGRIDASNALESDEIAPAAPENIEVIGTGLQSLNLVWSRSGDDGWEGEASAYELRFSGQPITKSNWQDAVRVNFKLKKENDSKVSVRVQGLELESSGYFAIQAVDNVGNYSDISESVSYQLPAVAEVFSNDGTESGFEPFTGSWGIDTSSESFPFIADSPGVQYKDDVNTSIETKAINLEKKPTLFNINFRYDFEKNYDFAYGDIKVGNGDWQNFAKFNGTISWQSRNYDISRFLKSNKSAVKFRFRVVSDSSMTAQGLDIAKIRVLQPSN